MKNYNEKPIKNKFHRTPNNPDNICTTQWCGMQDWGRVCGIHKVSGCPHRLRMERLEEAYRNGVLDKQWMQEGLELQPALLEIDERKLPVEQVGGGG